ncbi:MAG: TraR/DksA family transcriptional regulator [Hellea sp.]|nr:TraR/DksA family transcriptional regulator [Hellea sp.]
MDIKKYEKVLKDRLAYLNKHMHEIEDQLDDPPNPDWDDNAAEHESDEVLEDLGNMELHEARAIMAAMSRIKDGTFGTCMKCEIPISEERLDLVPHTPFCRDCAN